ncbi:hypothetical protein HK105_207018 [Polyrhizophydium stewartii]|uniref:NYN domain-containing protein n=1 Tax=Polyrhizophydium stewartii TaxID=2732419 RepID=A0ABR4N215_9FUNG
MATVYWDLENAGVPSGVRGFELVRCIKEALKLALVRNIVAVCNVSRFEAGLRTELQSAGVTLIDCASTKPSASDMAIVTELLKFTFDTRPPATIVLISSDTDFSKVLCFLTSVGYETVLVHGRQVSPALLHSVGRTVAWDAIVSDVRRTPQRGSQGRQASGGGPSGANGSRRSQSSWSSPALVDPRQVLVPVPVSLRNPPVVQESSPPKTGRTLPRPNLRVELSDDQDDIPDAQPSPHQRQSGQRTGAVQLGSQPAPNGHGGSPKLHESLNGVGPQAMQIPPPSSSSPSSSPSSPPASPPSQPAPLLLPPSSHQQQHQKPPLPPPLSQQQTHQQQTQQQQTQPQERSNVVLQQPTQQQPNQVQQQQMQMQMQMQSRPGMDTQQFQSMQQMEQALSDMLLSLTAAATQVHLRGAQDAASSLSMPPKQGIEPAPARACAATPPTSGLSGAESDRLDAAAEQKPIGSDDSGGRKVPGLGLLLDPKAQVLPN